jgi:hypothetical protein
VCAVRFRDQPQLVDARLRARLLGVLDVCEHERLALEGMGDTQMQGVLLALARLQAEIVAALATLGPPPQNGR